MMDPNLLQYPASLCAVLGAIIGTSMTRTVRLASFFLYAAANIMLMTWSIYKGDSWGMFAMYAVFLFTSFLGMWTHRKDPNAGTSIR